MVKDPPGQTDTVSMAVIIGTNVIRKNFEQLFYQYGPDLFDPTSQLGVPTAWLPALLLCQQIKVLDCLTLKAEV